MIIILSYKVIFNIWASKKAWEQNRPSPEWLCSRTIIPDMSKFHKMTLWYVKAPIWQSPLSKHLLSCGFPVSSA